MKRYSASIDVVLRPASLPPPSDVELPVTIAPSVYLVGLSKASVPFTIANPTASPIQFSATPTVTKDGAWKDRLTVAVRFDSFTVPAGGTFQNFLDVEASQAPLSEEVVQVTVSSEVA